MIDEQLRQQRAELIRASEEMASVLAQLAALMGRCKASADDQTQERLDVAGPFYSRASELLCGLADELSEAANVLGVRKDG